MDYFREHILTIVAFWPLAGMIVLMLFNKENKTLIRWWANFVMIVGFVISIPLWVWFDRDTADQMQFVQNIPWIQTIGANYHVGIDGISLLLVLLTTLLGPLAVLSSWSAIENRVKEYYVFMLMLQAGMLRVFISLDKTITEIMKPGMSAQVSLSVAGPDAPAPLLIPRSAVNFEGSAAQVIRIEGENLKRPIAVTILSADALHYAIADNGALKEGDRILQRWDK